MLFMDSFKPKKQPKDRLQIGIELYLALLLLKALFLFIALIISLT